VVLCLAMSLAPGARAQLPQDLKPQGYVNDFAGVINPETKQELNALCAEVDQKVQAQIAVVTVKSLEGEPIEDFSIDLATRWGIGPKQKDRGVMILLAPNDRRYRFEVGYGLEPILPDGLVGDFGRQARPLLGAGNYSGALLLMTQRVAAVIAKDRGVTLSSLAGQPVPSGNEGETSPAGGPNLEGFLTLAILMFFAFFSLLGFIVPLLRGRSRYGRAHGVWWWGGPWFMGGMGGGWGGGSWGGGGFGGDGGFGGFGGGSFGGGGASGSW
jgi:uncharacterized protein